MYKKIITFVMTLTLLAGLTFSPAQAYDSSKLERILKIAGLRPELNGLKARLDRDQFVYGLPNDIPDNDWKSAPTSWESDNGISHDHPGNQEPRYLGFTWNRTDLFSNSWFPDDASNKVSPAKRDMIENPWDMNYCYYQKKDDFSDDTWGVIQKALQNYHKVIGFDGDENSFINNPAFQGDFSKVRDYFKVLAEPRPGLAGTVRHWHYRDGTAYYQTITVNWDIIPDFIVKDIQSGVPQEQKAQPGQTYTGKVVLKAKPEDSFMSDPITKQLFDTMGYDLELSEDYAVPFGIAVNRNFIPVSGLEPIPGLTNIYYYKVKAGKADDTLEVPFTWTAGAGPVTIGAGVNESFMVLNPSVWGYMDWSEITSVNNALIKPVPTDAVNLKLTNFAVTPDTVDPGANYTLSGTVVNESAKDITTTVRFILDGNVLKEISVTLPPNGSVPVSESFSAPGSGSYDVGILVNPYHTPEEWSYDENYGGGALNVNFPAPPPASGGPASGTLTLNPNPAKWDQWVTATLSGEEPELPRIPRAGIGAPDPNVRMVSWRISSATLYYPKVASDWTFVHHVEPTGTVSVDMDTNGHSASIDFLEDWSNAGTPIYDMLADDNDNEERLAPKDYDSQVNFTIDYTYEWDVYKRVCTPMGGCSWEFVRTRTANDSVSGTVFGSLTVNGSLRIPLSQ